MCAGRGIRDVEGLGAGSRAEEHPAAHHPGSRTELLPWLVLDETWEKADLKRENQGWFDFN